MTRIPHLVLTAWVLAAAAAAQTQPSSYAGQQSREIKALSPEQIQGYLSGHGMALALPAELNGYPGPRHVLELASELELSPEQSQRVQAVFDLMHRKAVHLGERIVEAEAELDDLFAGGVVTADAMGQALDDLGVLQARLRYVHLRAHLDTRSVLGAEQIARYGELRGYAAARPRHDRSPDHR